MSFIHSHKDEDYEFCGQRHDTVAQATACEEALLAAIADQDVWSCPVCDATGGSCSPVLGCGAYEQSETLRRETDEDEARAAAMFG